MTTLYTSVNKIHLQITRHFFPEPNLSTWMVQKHTSCIFPQQQKIFRKLFVSTKVNSLNPVKLKVAQSCPTLCDAMAYTVRGILQAKILEWVAFPFSRGSSQPRDWTQVSRIAGGFFTSWATREAQSCAYWAKLTRYRKTTRRHIGKY